MIGVDSLVTLLFLCMWPFWSLYLRFVSSFNIIRVIINEMKKVVILLICNIPLTLFILGVLFCSSLLLVYLYIGGYLVVSSFRSFIVILVIPLYILFVNGYRVIAIRLIPLPFFFLKIGISLIIVYVVILYGTMLFI